MKAKIGRSSTMKKGTLESKLRIPSMWAIRAGKKGEAHELFLDHDIIALTDSDLSNLRKLPAKRQAFYKEYQKRHPEDTRIGVSGIGGKFFRFVHEIQTGDMVLYPSLKDKQIYIGKIVGEYSFNLKPNPKFPHRRGVIWEYVVSKTALSETAKRELGAARTFFEYKTHAKEILEMITENKVIKYRTIKHKKVG